MSGSESEILARMHRRFVSNFLDFSILLKLRNGSVNEQDMVSYVHKRFNVNISPGIVYSCLHYLERKQLVRAVGEQKKKACSLTEQGEQMVRDLLNMRDKILGLVLNIFIG